MKRMIMLISKNIYVYIVYIYIYICIDLKIILLDHQNNYIGNSRILMNDAKKLIF